MRLVREPIIIAGRVRNAPSCLVLLALLLVAVASSVGPVARAGARGETVVAMVLPREEQGTEGAFREFVGKRVPGVRFVSLAFPARPDGLPQWRTRLRQLQPDLIYTWGTPATVAVLGARPGAAPAPVLPEVPVVFAEVTDPIGSGIVASLARPGGNATGVLHVAPLSVQWNALNTWRKVRRLGYVGNPHEGNNRLVRAALAEVVERDGAVLIDANLPLTPAGQPDLDRLPDLMQQLAAKEVDFLYFPPSNFLPQRQRATLVRLALAARIPTFCPVEEMVREAGCMFGLFSSGANMGRLAGYKAVSILIDKTPPAQVPVESLQAFTILINMPVAAALGVYPPMSLLGIADVIAAPQSAAKSLAP